MTNKKTTIIIVLILSAFVLSAKDIVTEKAFSLKYEGEGVSAEVYGDNYGPYSWASHLFFSTSGKTWGFQAVKKMGRSTIILIIINGEEHYGENLSYFKQDDAEYFLWLSFDENENIYVNQLEVF